MLQIRCEDSWICTEVVFCGHGWVVAKEGMLCFCTPSTPRACVDSHERMCELESISRVKRITCEGRGMRVLKGLGAPKPRTLYLLTNVSENFSVVDDRAGGILRLI